MTDIKKFADFRAGEGENVSSTVSPAATENPAEAEAADVDPSDIPVLFATIHHKSDQRPNGYTAEDIADLNNVGNAHRAAPAEKDEKPNG